MPTDLPEAGQTHLKRVSSAFKCKTRVTQLLTQNLHGSQFIQS